MRCFDGRRGGLVFVLLLLAALGTEPGSAAAQPAFSLLCPLFRQQEREDGEDLQLKLEVARVNLAGAQQILDLLERLMAKNAVRRLSYLGGRHARDMRRLDVERTRIEIEREAAESAQYRIACAKLPPGAGPAERDAALREAKLLYLEADCELQGKDAERAGIDLDYWQEVHASMSDLRDRDVAAVQEVISALVEVERAKAEQVRAKRRAKQCRERLERGRAPGADQEVDPFGDA